ncbi:MAG TPA: hypothetical protein VKA68_04825 [bacterium]|nr:hypothetical protein [bacterium]
MKDQDLYQLLLELAERLDIEIVHEKGDFNGGYCRVQQDRRIVLNKHHLLSTKLRMLARNLLRFNLANIYIVPAVREFLEEIATEEDLDSTISEEQSDIEKD